MPPPVNGIPDPRLFGESRRYDLRRSNGPTPFNRRLVTPDTFRVGLCLPMRGTAGIWGPSCLASAQLGQAELNRLSGIAGRECELRLIDVSHELPDIEDTVSDLIEAGEIEALVGMSLSSVRRRILRATGGRIPFVYTVHHEGGDTTPSLFAIAETTPLQLPPSIAWLSAHSHVRRWMLVGNDYIYPWVTHGIARASIACTGDAVVGEMYLPFGVNDYSEVIDRIRRSRADAVLISLIGQDAVEFNRAFGYAGLCSKVLRLSGTIEENQLLAIGAENTENLHVALGYFSTLDTDANRSFKERYYGHFGDRAPTHNSIGQSVYEGMHFLAALVDVAERQEVPPCSVSWPIGYASAREPVGAGAKIGRPPVYLAVAEGLSFRVLTRF
jgi:urea transport system substrate-binding protein